jgi:lipopolysaccharide biosynthesis glycosyltransferase
MAHYLPKNRERALFLDSDMIVRKEISTLWHTNLGDNLVAAVQDPRIKTFDNDWGGIKNFQQLGLNGKLPYFNAGLYLVDLARWEAEQIGRKILNCVQENIEYANYPDQYAANIILHGRWHHLESDWNHFASEQNPDPYLIHFISRKPMYTTYEYSKVYQEEFYRYLHMTEWKNFKPIGESARYIQKLRKILDKLKAKFR